MSELGGPIPMMRAGALLLTAVAVCLAQANAPYERTLINPRVRAAEVSAASAAALRGDFADPPAEYRPMPLWVWNDQMSWPRLQEQLVQFKQQGMGGVFVHPRPGLMTEYLGADWFRLWKMAAAEGRRLGLFVNIYDENSYPAGFAGGAVRRTRNVTSDCPGGISAADRTRRAVALVLSRNTLAEPLLDGEARMAASRLRRAGTEWQFG